MTEAEPVPLDNWVRKAVKAAEICIELLLVLSMPEVLADEPSVDVEPIEESVAVLLEALLVSRIFCSSWAKTLPLPEPETESDIAGLELSRFPSPKNSHKKAKIWLLLPRGVGFAAHTIPLATALGRVLKIAAGWASLRVGPQELERSRMPLHSRTAVVTGSTSGIGLAIAKTLAGQGVNILLNGFGEADAVAALVQFIVRDHGVRCVHSAADMSKPEEIAAMIAEAESTFGAVDILVNNAGIQRVSPIEDFPIDAWNAIIAINLSSSFHTIRAAVPGMKRRKWGRIINTASAHSLVASPFKSAYVAAKHGLAGLTKTIALELATFGVTANCISPGYVWTPLVEKQIPDTMKARNLTRDQVINDVVLAAQPTKQFVTVEQVAATALFLCSDDAAQITGANIVMDGGWTAA